MLAGALPYGTRQAVLSPVFSRACPWGVRGAPWALTVAVPSRVMFALPSERVVVLGDLSEVALHLGEPRRVRQSAQAGGLATVLAVRIFRSAATALEHLHTYANGVIRRVKPRPSRLVPAPVQAERDAAQIRPRRRTSSRCTP